MTSPSRASLADQSLAARAQEAIAGAPLSSSRTTWTMVAVLTVFAMLAAIDKNFLTLAVPLIKADFGLSDVQIGLLIGLAFAVSNVAISLPAGWLADRANRRAIVAGGVLLWSVTAATCGFARSYGQLFLARVGVGLGEGISPPASYSLIRDGVPAEKRGMAYAIYALGTPFGSGLAFVIGGLLITAITSLDLHGVPLLGKMPSWQIALVVIGVAGVPIAPLAFIFPDPGRGEAVAADRASFRATLAMAHEQRQVLVPLLIFSVLHAMIASGLAAWVPALLVRSYHLEVGGFGLILGLVLIGGATLGLIGAGIMMDRLGGIGPAIVAIMASVILTLSGSVAPHAPSISVYWPLQGIIIMSSVVYLPTTSTLVAKVMPSTMIGTTMAFFLFVQGIVGSGLGPLVVAMFTQHVFGDAPGALNAAITTVSLIFGTISLLASVAILTGSRRLQAA